MRRLMYLFVVVALMLTACNKEATEAPKDGVRNGQEYVENVN